MSCTACTDVYINNDHVLKIDNLRDSEDVNIDNATITYAFYDLDDTEVVGATGTMTAVGAGGDYTGSIDQAIIDLLDSGEEYWCRVTGASGTVDFEFNVLVKVKRRGIT